MSSLTYREKQRLERLFEMGGGFVLDFSNRTFDEFIRDVVGIEIYDTKYDYESGSKANRLRAFWRIEPDATVAQLLNALIEEATFEGTPDPKLVEFARKVVARLRSPEASRSGRHWDVALSFAGEQRGYVEQVAAGLTGASVRVFYDEFVDLWGKDLPVEFEKAFRSGSTYVVIFVSAEYVSKMWPNYEREHALMGRIERRDGSVLPVMCDGTELPGLPASVGYVSMADMTPEEMARRIVRRVRAGRR